MPFVAAVRAEFPDLVISVDTWRAEVGREVCACGRRPAQRRLGRVRPGAGRGGRRARRGPGLHAHQRRHAPDAAAPPVLRRRRRLGHRASTVALAERAVSLGVRRDSLLIDPAHDFDKNTWHSLELTRRLDEMVATGWPVLVSLSNKDFVGGDARRARSRSGWSGPSPPRRSAPGRAPASSGCTTSRRPGRRSTWSRASVAPGRRPGSCGGWRDRHRRALPAPSAAAA